VITGPDGCPQIGGYTVQAGVDAAGDMYQAASVADAFAACNTDSRCQGFNSWGVLKNDTTASTSAPIHVLVHKEGLLLQ
jgi:hypothetical protein